MLCFGPQPQCQFPQLRSRDEILANFWATDNQGGSAISFQTIHIAESMEKTHGGPCSTLAGNKLHTRSHCSSLSGSGAPVQSFPSPQIPCSSAGELLISE